MDNILRKIILILALDKKIVGLLDEIHEVEISTIVKEKEGLILNREELLKNLTTALNYYQTKRNILKDELTNLDLEELTQVANFIQRLDTNKKLEMLMLITEVTEQKENTLNR